eukprot:4395585-Prymnesium_polylepis.2
MKLLVGDEERWREHARAAVDQIYSSMRKNAKGKVSVVEFDRWLTGQTDREIAATEAYLAKGRRRSLQLPTGGFSPLASPKGRGQPRGGARGNAPPMPSRAEAYGGGEKAETAARFDRAAHMQRRPRSADSAVGGPSAVGEQTHAAAGATSKSISNSDGGGGGGGGGVPRQRRPPDSALTELAPPWPRAVLAEVAPPWPPSSGAAVPVAHPFRSATPLARSR